MLFTPSKAHVILFTTAAVIASSVFAVQIFRANALYITCKFQNGELRDDGRACGPEGLGDECGFCYLPTLDEGKICFSNFDCSEDCIYEGVDDAGNVVGVCGRSTEIECKPEVPFATTSTDDLVLPFVSCGSN